MSRPLVHIIDGSGYIFRAFYAVRSLSTASGDATNAVYGFSNMLEKLIREDEPSLLAIVFDAGGNNFRHDIFPEYKSNRDAPPEDLTAQVPHIHRVVDAFNIHRFVIDGVEADDVIATLTRMTLESDRDVRLITGDKDLMQLVGDRVTLWEPMRSNRFTPAEVTEKLGVPPEQVADALALAGDSADNIPGVAT
ncbi:MAG: DNA polymerase I, partial [Myxococcota bacterium]